MLYFGVPMWLAGLTFLCILLTVLRWQRRSPSYLFCFSIFWIYLLLVLQATIFPVPLREDLAMHLITKNIAFILSRVNLIPFKYLSFSNGYLIFREILQNIALTVPFGFGISFLARLKARDFLSLPIIVGLSIEAAQLVVSLLIVGVYRVVDITDVLLNALGVLIGYGFFRVFAWLYPVITARLRVGRRGLFAYIHEVVRQA